MVGLSWLSRVVWGFCGRHILIWSFATQCGRSSDGSGVRSVGYGSGLDRVLLGMGATV